MDDFIITGSIKGGSAGGCQTFLRRHGKSCRLNKGFHILETTGAEIRCQDNRTRYYRKIRLWDGEFALGRCRVWKMHHAARPSKLALTPSVHEVK